MVQSLQGDTHYLDVTHRRPIPFGGLVKEPRHFGLRSSFGGSRRCHSAGEGAKCTFWSSPKRAGVGI